MGAGVLRALSLSCGQRVRRMRKMVARSERGSVEGRRGCDVVLGAARVDDVVVAEPEAEWEVIFDVARDLGRG
jgi:hypothetical protein